MLHEAAERALLHMGITFNVYGDKAAAEKVWPFDVLPRMMQASEWEWIECGLKQRLQALNLFLDDIYHDQKIVKDGIIPREIIQSTSSFRPACVGLNPPNGVWCHITGPDLSVTETDRSTRSKIICAVRSASPMCWPTARCSRLLAERHAFGHLSGHSAIAPDSPVP